MAGKRRKLDMLRSRSRLSTTSGGEWLYGHNWVCLAMLMSHPVFGVIALPLQSLLYVRKVDIEELKQRDVKLFDLPVKKPGQRGRVRKAS